MTTLLFTEDVTAAREARSQALAEGTALVASADRIRARVAEAVEQGTRAEQQLMARLENARTAAEQAKREADASIARDRGRAAEAEAARTRQEAALADVSAQLQAAITQLTATRAAYEKLRAAAHAFVNQ